MRSTESIWLELGAGNRRGHNGWVTIDLDLGADLTWDLRRGIPFLDGSVARLYSSHLLEHLDAVEVAQLLDESLRVLQPGGVFSVCVPDARAFIEAYVDERPLDPMHYDDSDSIVGIDKVNRIAYMGGAHKNMFDQTKLLDVLKQHGFREVRAREFDPALDHAGRDHESIYAVGTK